MSSVSSVVNYSYDVLGRRISRVESEISNPPSAITNWFVYNGHQVVADLDENGNIIRSYTWGPRIDNLLALTVHPPEGSGLTHQVYYPLKDHLNSVLALADENGNIVESYEYDAWGNVLGIRDGSGTVLSHSEIGNRYLWQGREYDSETGLYYFRARWYNPETGRWLSKDPIGIAGGLNLYAFCEDNPVNFVDPWGEMSRPNDTYREAFEKGRQANQDYQDALDEMMEMALNPDARKDAHQKEEELYKANDERNRITKEETRNSTDQAWKDLIKEWIETIFFGCGVRL